jgi:hypothetical protein
MQINSVLRLLFICIGLFLLQILTYGQGDRDPVGCGGCEINVRTFSPVGGIVSTTPTSVNTTNSNWIGGNYPGSTGTARFENRGTEAESFYRWLAGQPGSGIGGNNTVELTGLIIESGVTLEIGRFNANETPAFNIIGGCILVKDGATLNFSYYTQMKDLRICVEEGGKINFDSRPPGGADGDRDIFRFEDIEINLLGPGAQITFGNAEIDQLGFIVIDGFEGQGCIDNGNGTLSPPLSPPANIDVDLSRMTQAELALFCNFLSNAGFSIQPVEYIYFNSSFDPGNRNAQLSWATSKEWDNSHFEIERSDNGAKTWEKVGRMEGRGWSDMPVGYEFLDEELPLAGGNVFYRLKQVDFNGSFAYSNVVSVKVPFLQLTKGVWRVYPNPTTGEKFRIDLLNPKAYQGEKIQVRLVTSTAGDKIFTGNDIREISLQLEEVFNRTYNGVYILEISWGQKIEHIKVLRQ